MLTIDMEFRKGMLFVRLEGELIKDTVGQLHDEVTALVKDNGVRRIVFNLEGLTKLDIKGINALLYNYELVVGNQGVSLVCGIKDNTVSSKIRNSRLLKYMSEVTDEISAIHLMK